MKTVMKKMFSLLLVAVLLVSAMPVAFADGTTYTVDVQITGDVETSKTVQAAPSDTVGSIYNWVANNKGINAASYNATFTWHANGSSTPVDTSINIGENGTLVVTLSHTHNFGSGVVTKAPTCSVAGELSYTCTICGHVHKDSTHASVQPTGHVASEGSCTEDKVCVSCGIALITAPGHTPGPAATCTTAQTCTTCGAELEAAMGHNYGADGKCTRAGCTASETGTHQVYFSVNGDQNFWHLGVKHNHTVKAPGFTYGTDYTFLNQVGDTATQKFLGWSKNPSATTASELEYIVEMPVKESVTYYAIYQAKQPSSDSGNTGSGNTGSNNNNSSNINIPSGSHSLKVYARIWVHETKFETRLLDTITGLSGDAKIYQVIAANKDHLNAILPYDEFKALHWSETVNYLDDDKEYKDVGTSMTVGNENEVYVNLYSAEQLIVVNVHTSKTWAYDLSVRIEGFRPGDLVTYEDVLKAVKKYYNVSSMKMFTYEEMCDYLEGGKADQIDNFIAGEKDDPYEVFISGSRKSGAYKYTADSTNPKTGDEIFVPMAVLGLSASALAVMFYLNKKRAY